MLPALELSGISKAFDGAPALAGADFTLLPGEVHALLGENGAGKSSLMNVAAGLYAPDAGSIRVQGTDVLIRGPTDAKALSIGMVHQHYKLVMPFSAVENVLLANRRSGYARGAAEIEAEMRSHSEALGFDIDLHRPVGSLSIAEQQRVEIVKVLIGGARILILDEPTAVLTDQESERLLTHDPRSGRARHRSRAGDPQAERRARLRRPRDRDARRPDGRHRRSARGLRR